jgi:hypothetical protein
MDFHPPVVRFGVQHVGSGHLHVHALLGFRHSPGKSLTGDNSIRLSDLVFADRLDNQITTLNLVVARVGEFSLPRVQLQAYVIVPVGFTPDQVDQPRHSLARLLRRKPVWMINMFQFLCQQSPTRGRRCSRGFGGRGRRRRWRCLGCWLFVGTSAE